MASYVFGPVPSRRLGRSLGIDLVPFKTCTYDCIYCQLGRTTLKTVERKEWVPLEKVLVQLQNALSSTPDYITLSGSGEPTLYSRIGELISGIKEITSIPVAVLTNGSLMGETEVRQALRRADLIIPSLDAGDADMFRFVNRPHKEIRFDDVVKGLIDFRKSYSGQLWLEVFLLGGITGISSEVRKIAAIARRINPDRIQLNTVCRPPAEDFAYTVSEKKLRDFAQIFGDDCEIIAAIDSAVFEKGKYKVSLHDVLEMLERRPCTVEDIARGLRVHIDEAVKYIQKLESDGKILTKRINGRIYFCSKEHPQSHHVYGQKEKRIETK